ncbi:hypothetical protein Tco_0998435, partial [Tanacetum coccineum]
EVVPKEQEVVAGEQNVVAKDQEVVTKDQEVVLMDEEDIKQAMEEKARYAMIGLEKAGQEEEWDAIIDLLNDYRFPVEDESMDVDTFNTTKASINFHMNTQEYVIHVEAASTTIQPEDLQEANLESASFKPASVVAAQSKPAQLELAQSKTAIVEPASKKKGKMSHPQIGSRQSKHPGA